jgi:hypothetical protein
MLQTTALNLINNASNFTISCLRFSSGLHPQLFILLQETLFVCALKPQNAYFCDRIEVCH